MSDIENYFNRGARWLADALDSGDFRGAGARVGKAKQAQSLAESGIALYQRDEYAAARVFLLESQSLYRGLIAEKRTPQLETALTSILYLLGRIALKENDFVTARQYGEEACALAHNLNDLQLLLLPLSLLVSVAFDHGDYPNAQFLLEEFLQHSRTLNNPRCIAAALNDLGTTYLEMRDDATARRCYEESLEIYQTLDDVHGMAGIYNNLGCLITPGRTYEAERDYLSKSLRLFRELDDRKGIAFVLINLGRIARYEGDYATALSMVRLSLGIGHETGSPDSLAFRDSIVYILRECAAVALAQEQGQRAARLYAAADELHEKRGFPTAAREYAEYEENILKLVSALGEEAFVTACAEGRAMTPEQAIAYASQGEEGVERA